MDTQCIVKYSVLSIVFFAVCIFIYTIISKPSNLQYTFQKYFFVYMFPLLMIFAIILNLGKDEMNRKPFLEVFGVVVIMAIAVYYYALSDGVYLDISAWANYFLVIAIGLVGLAILYNSLIGYMSRLDGWPGFIAQLIFYLPCVLYDAWLYLLNQFALTPLAIYGFILLEIILIIVYIYLPSFTDIVIGTDNSVILVKDVIPLNKGRVTVATSSILKNTPTSEQIKMGITTPYFPRNYCISLWVFTNPQDPSNLAYSRESQILNYGHLDQTGVFQVKPLITYYGGGNITDQPMERNKFVFYFVNYKDIQVEDAAQTTISNIQIELHNTSNKIASLMQTIDNPELTDEDKTGLQTEIGTLQAYSARLQISSQKMDVTQQIQRLTNAIAGSKLSQTQIVDLDRTRSQAQLSLTLLQSQEELSPEELLLLENRDYDKMKHTFYPLTLPDQKWNQIVLNYYDNSVDLFINGKLERTFYLAGKNIPPGDFKGPGSPSTFLPQYSDLDTITVGDTNGIDGGICNVVYYREPLNPEQIVFTYNQMVNHNPPVPR